MVNKLRILALLLATALFRPALVQAQTLTASLTGTVADHTGALLPGATVILTNSATRVKAWEGTTDARGEYRALGLPVGVYDIGVELSGFKSVAIQGVRLQVDQHARVDAQMSLGAVSETVTVEGDTAGRLESESSSMGSVINTSQVRNLPLPNRNVLNLLTLVGGVSSGGAATGINASQLSINGSRVLNSEFTVDGVSVVSGSTGGLNRLPSSEALREFKVLTASYSAEYGRTAGAFVNAVVDSGTDTLKGGVYEYFRNEKLNANNFFRNARGEERPPDRYNSFGAKLGGPLRLPGLYDGKGKTFFFLNYEGVRRRSPASPLSTIPDLAFRGGDFSASTIPVIDPLTGRPFPGNRIPANRIDPAAAKIMGLLPEPNLPGTADALNGRRVNNYINNSTIVPTSDEMTLRLDHAKGPETRIFGRLTAYRSEDPIASRIPGPLDTEVGTSNTKGYQAALGWTQVWKPTLLTDVSFGYLRDDPQIRPPSQDLDVPTVLGIQRAAFAAAPRFNISGYQFLGTNENTYRSQVNNNYQGSASLTWMRGAHALKTGVQVRFNQFDVFNPGQNFVGVYSFNGEITSPTRSGGNPVNALADFLLGQIQTAVYELPQPTTGRRNHNYALFVQDDWKATRRLTLNLGLRYEYESPMTVKDNIYSRLDPATGRLLAAGLNASETLDLEADKVNLAPRIGLAYTLNPKTVVRSAFGFFYGQIFSNLGGVVLYPGFTVRQNFPDLGVGIAQPFPLHQGHPLTAVQNLQDPFGVERNASAANPLAGTAQFGDIKPLPYTLQWNVGVQREVLDGTIVDLSYVGSRGKHLPLSRPFNQFPYERGVEIAAAASTLVTQNARPFPNVAGFGSFVHVGNSWYHGLQVKGTRQFSSRFGFQGTYTFSKAMDDGSGLFNFSQPNGIDGGQFEGQFPELNRAVSAFDRPHIFALALQYTTGGPRWVRNIETNLIVTARSGLPDTITQSNLHPLAGQQRPSIVGDNVGGYAPERTPEDGGIRMLYGPNDPNFPFRPTGPLFSGSGASRRMVLGFDGPGNLGRNTTREPGEFNVDLAVARRFKLAGRVGLMFRVEAFNVLNRVNLNAPNTALSVIVDPRTGQPVFNSPSFGLITSAKSARFLQLVARLDF
jgi:outer membrane receptor protein involved in Fe transport